MSVLKSGSKGADVVTLQQDLVKLGYDVTVDGQFGQQTETAVRHLQKAFGYDIDGQVGDGTLFLVKQQIGYNWKSTNHK